MRLSKLDHGHRMGTKALFGIIGLVSRKPVPDVMKTLRYRPDFFGHEFGNMVQAVLRGPSQWSIGERELFAAFTSRLEACRF